MGFFLGFDGISWVFSWDLMGFDGFFSEDLMGFNGDSSNRDFMGFHGNLILNGLV